MWLMFMIESWDIHTLLKFYKEDSISDDLMQNGWLIIRDEPGLNRDPVYVVG